MKIAKFEHILSRKKIIEDKLANNDWDSREEFVQISKELNGLVNIVLLNEKNDSILSALKDNRNLLQEDNEDPEMIDLINEEIEKLELELADNDKKLKQALLPPDKNDGRPVIVEIRAGTGGEEASLFSGELFRMYQRFTELQGLSIEVLSASQSGLKGFKEVAFSVKGENAWKYLKYESGTHRVQRVPVTESSGRIHTSAVTVAILAEPEEASIDINPKDLRIDTFRSSGPGGQSVNTMDSAIRITHLPTNLVVSCQDEKSQHKNKQKAMRILRARLLDRIQKEEMQKRVNDRRSQIGSGDRSEKIRTYNFPQNRVTDHRINLTLYNLTEILDGKLDDISFALLESEYNLKMNNIV